MSGICVPLICLARAPFTFYKTFSVFSHYDMAILFHSCKNDQALSHCMPIPITCSCMLSLHALIFQLNALSLPSFTNYGVQKRDSKDTGSSGHINIVCTVHYRWAVFRTLGLHVWTLASLSRLWFCLSPFCTVCRSYHACLPFVLRFWIVHFVPFPGFQ